MLIPLIIGRLPRHLPRRPARANWSPSPCIRRGIVIVLTLSGLATARVAPEVVGLIGAGLLLLGPLVWGAIRQTRGLPAFDNNAAAWRVPDRD